MFTIVPCENFSGLSLRPFLWLKGRACYVKICLVSTSLVTGNLIEKQWVWVWIHLSSPLHSSSPLAPSCETDAYFICTTRISSRCNEINWVVTAATRSTLRRTCIMHYGYFSIACRTRNQPTFCESWWWNSPMHQNWESFDLPAWEKSQDRWLTREIREWRQNWVASREFHLMAHGCQSWKTWKPWVMRFCCESSAEQTSH